MEFHGSSDFDDYHEISYYRNFGLLYCNRQMIAKRRVT